MTSQLCLAQRKRCQRTVWPARWSAAPGFRRPVRRRPARQSSPCVLTACSTFRTRRRPSAVCSRGKIRRRSCAGRPAAEIGSLEALLANTAAATGDTPRDPHLAHLLAPCDLQVIKAAGVTFAASLIERVIEERAKGDPQGALQVRTQIKALVVGGLVGIRPDWPRHAT